MRRIELNAEKMAVVNARMVTLIQKVNDIASNGYVTGNLFDESCGKSADAMNDLLAVLSETSGQLAVMVTKFNGFLEEAVEGFTAVDLENAQKINGG